MNTDYKVTVSMDDYNFSDYYNNNDNYVYIPDYEGAVCNPESSMNFNATFIPVLYSLMLVVGVVGNGLVLVVLWKKRRSLNITDIFMLHMSFACILLLLTLPFWAVGAAKGWVFGTPLCKLSAALFKIGFYCGIFMLSCISLDRYLSIVHAVQMYSRKKPMVIHCCCLMVWFFCFLLSIPEWMFHVATVDTRRPDKTECVPFYPHLLAESLHLATRLLYHILGFILPAFTMVFCYSCILLRLQRGYQCLQKKRAMCVIVALVLAFFICWTPYNLTLIADTVQTKEIISPINQNFCDMSPALDVALTVTSSLGYFHCCVNPVLYLVLHKSLSRSESADTSHTSVF